MCGRVGLLTIMPQTPGVGKPGDFFLPGEGTPGLLWKRKKEGEKKRGGRVGCQASTTTTGEVL